MLAEIVIGQHGAHDRRRALLCVFYRIVDSGIEAPPDRSDRLTIVQIGRIHICDKAVLNGPLQHRINIEKIDVFVADIDKQFKELPACQLVGGHRKGFGTG